MKITPKDRLFAALEHRTLDRIPICETHYWPETIARWRSEGLPAGTDPADYFGIDVIDSYSPFDNSFFPHEIYEETGEYIVDLNGVGTVVKWRKNRGTDEGHIDLEHRVKTIEDWREARKRLNISEERFNPIPDLNPERFRVLSLWDHFWTSFVMCGMENLCVWLIQAPEEMREIYSDYVDFLLGMLDLSLKRDPDFDAVWFFSDLAYHSGPMFSPRTFQDVLAPGYRRIKQWCEQHGKWMLLHSDGNLLVLLPELIDVGFDWIHPLEARAGNDVRELKPLYGSRITLVGNINTDILSRGDLAEVEDEIAEKITAAKTNGGYVYHIDHSVPPGISFETYSKAMEWVHKYGAY
jgi:uroporphyrinogen decarboxylase